MRLSYTIDPAALREVCPALTDRRARELARNLGTALHRFQPDIGARAAAHFIGQCAHESGEFRYAREIWGPTPVQRRYWQRRDIQGLDPVWPGLGFLTRGGGWIQTTGRVNYRRAARRLGRRSWTLLAAHAGRDDIASLLAAVWWADHFPASMRDWTVLDVTLRVNGGKNGLAHREVYTDRAMKVRRRLQPRPL